MEPGKFTLKKVGEDIPRDTTLADDEVEVTPDKIKEITLKNASIQDAANKIPCIHCESLLEQGTILCVHCGTNQITGKGTETKSKKKKEVKKKKSRIISSYDKGVNYKKIVLTALLVISGIIYFYTKGDLSFLFPNK